MSLIHRDASLAVELNRIRIVWSAGAAFASKSLRVMSGCSRGDAGALLSVMRQDYTLCFFHQFQSVGTEKKHLIMDAVVMDAYQMHLIMDAVRA